MYARVTRFYGSSSPSVLPPHSVLRLGALGEAQEKACNEFVTALVAKKDRLE